MIDLPDELILLLLEKIGDGNSLLRCRKACRLLYRISLDRILLRRFNGIIAEDENGLLLPEEVMNNRDLFTTVIEDGRWRRMIDNLARSRFRLFETLMPDNGVQSFLTMTIINDAARYVARDAAHNAVWDVDYDSWDNAWDDIMNTALDTATYAAWNTINDIVAWSDSWDAAARCSRYTFDEVKDIIKNIITGESNPTIMEKRSWYVGEYLYLIKTIHDDTWNTVYHLLDEVDLPETIPPFGNSPTLQDNIHIMEYKRLFSVLEK
jgi:hypothetical protein